MVCDAVHHKQHTQHTHYIHTYTHRGSSGRMVCDAIHHTLPHTHTYTHTHAAVAAVAWFAMQYTTHCLTHTHTHTHTLTHTHTHTYTHAVVAAVAWFAMQYTAPGQQLMAWGQGLVNTVMEKVSYLAGVVGVGARHLFCCAIEALAARL